MTDVSENKFAAPFEEMAVRIKRNLPEEFAGAMLIVPPTGDAIAVMIADPKQDKEAFFALCAGKLQVATEELRLEKQCPAVNWPRR